MGVEEEGSGMGERVERAVGRAGREREGNQKGGYSQLRRECRAENETFER